MKIRKYLHYFTMYLSLLASILLSYAAFFFLKNNQPIIKNFYLLAVLVFLPIIFIFWASIRELRRAASEPDGRPRQRPMSVRVIFCIFCIFTAGILAYLILFTVSMGYFYDYLLHDGIVSSYLIAFVLLIIRMLIDGIRYLINFLGSRHTIYFNVAILLMLAVIIAWKSMPFVR